MSSDRRPVSMNPDEELAQRWVGAAPESAPSAEARKRARSVFLTGNATGRIVPMTAPASPGRLRLWPWAAVAAAVAGLAFWGAQPSEHWTVTSVNGEASLQGQVALADVTARAGTARTSQDSWFETRLGERLLVRVGPRSRVDLPAGPGRWLSGERTLRIHEGEIYASTGHESLGFPLRIETAEATTTIVGTTFAVRRNELGTCVCLLEGRVDLEGGHGETASVPTGRRVQIFSDGTEPIVEDLTPEEISLLQGLLESASR